VHRTHAHLAAIAVAACLASCGGSPSGPSGTTPRITAIVPVTGSTFGGTVVTITGANFSSSATVSIGGAAARDVSAAGSTTLTATTTQHVAGAADVVVTVAGESATLHSGFTYVTPPVTNNQPPVITSLTAQGTRPNEPERFADVGEPIEVKADVTDVETAPDRLQYVWAAPVGTFSGNGASVTWRAPDVFVTPALVTLSLTVVETFTATDPSGLPVSAQNKTVGTVDVNLHDSVQEVSGMATQFMTDFSKQLPVGVVLQNFMDCTGRDAEASDIGNNQEKFVINSYELSPATSQVNFRGTCGFRARKGDGCSQVPVVWQSTVKASGLAQTTRGTDHITAFYVRPRWWLCDSDFEGMDSLGIPLMR
jgi:hypothetical protein